MRSVAELRCPVFVVCGSDDVYATAAETEELHAAAPEPKDLWLVNGARHDDLFACDGYRERVLGFFDRYLRA